MATVDIRHNDTVKVIAGRDKGKQGRVLRVMPEHRTRCWSSTSAS